MKFAKHKFFRVVCAAILVTLMNSESRASTSVLLHLFHIDDDMKVFVTNNNVTNLLIGTFPFSTNTVIDLSGSMSIGLNTIRMELYNGPSGWTYGFDLIVQGQSIASESCGIFNTRGCKNDEYLVGKVWEKELTLSIPPGIDPKIVPSPVAGAGLTTLVAFAGGLWLRRRRAGRSKSNPQPA